MSNLLTNIRFLYDGRDLSADGNTIAMSETYAMETATRFVDTAYINRPGLPTGKFSYAGYTQFGSGKVEETIATHKGLSVPILACPAPGTVGGRCHFFQAGQATLDPIKGSAGKLMGFSIDGVSASGSGGILDGYLLEDGKTARTIVLVSPGVQVGAIAATQSLYAIAHLIAQDTGIVTVTIQSSVDNTFASPTNRLVFPGLAAPIGAYAVSALGAVTDTWWRATWAYSAGATSITLAVAMAIR